MKIRLSDKSKIIYKKKIFDSSELDVIKQHVYEIVIEARFTKETAAPKHRTAKADKICFFSSFII